MSIKETIKNTIGSQNIMRISRIKYLKDDLQALKLYKNSLRLDDISLSSLQHNVCKYVDSMEIDKYKYVFSSKVSVPTLYSSVYACMIKGLFDQIDKDIIHEWICYYNNFQRDDGLFVDPNSYNEKYLNGDGWGARHLIPHIIIAYKRLGGVPKREFAYLNRFINPDNMVKWLKSLNYKKIWSTSNAIMNYGVALQYARDYMNMKTGKSIEAMQEWLLKSIRKDCGMWFEGDIKNRYNQYQAIRGAYHIYPILLYDRIKIPYSDKAIEIIINNQNRWGGFDSQIGSSACDDIDAIDPLIRLAAQLELPKSYIEPYLKKALHWIFVNQNKDGGFVFSRRGGFAYGGHETLSSDPHQSNMFATWFRTLSILYIYEYLGISKMNFVNIPGYEMPIFEQ